MAYIGREPVTGNFVKLDSITVVNGQAAYTMNNGGSAFTAYDNVNQFLVSLNGILQAPTDSFTVSGSTLTFASNLATGDVIDFVIVLGDTLDIGTPSDNTVSLAKLTATGTKNSTTFLRGDNTFASAGGNNTPAFYATLSSDQTINDNTATKVQLNNEILDTDNNFDNSSNYRFTPTTAGKYLIFGAVMLNAQINTNMDVFEFYLQKNSTPIAQTTNTFLNNPIRETQGTLSCVVDMDGSSDYIEMYAYIDTGSNGAGLVKGHSSPRARTYMGGMKIIT